VILFCNDVVWFEENKWFQYVVFNELVYLLNILSNIWVWYTNDLLLELCSNIPDFKNLFSAYKSIEEILEFQEIEMILGG